MGIFGRAAGAKRNSSRPTLSHIKSCALGTGSGPSGLLRSCVGIMPREAGRTGFVSLCIIDERMVPVLLEDKTCGAAAVVRAPVRGETCCRADLEAAAAGHVVGSPGVEDSVGGSRQGAALPDAGRRLRRTFRPLR